MRKSLLTITAAVCTLAASAQWTNQNVPLPYDGYINDIEVVNSNVVWGNPFDAGSTNGYTADFVRTIDGGATWTHGTIAAGGDIVANIWPIDASICYVSTVSLTTGGGGVFKTIDGGTTWNQVSLPTMFAQATSFADFVYFSDANNGVVMGDPAGPAPNKYEIWTTTDGGLNWTRTANANLPVLTNAAEFGITNLFTAAGGNIWFGTTYGDVYKSSDMGVTWTKTATGLPASTAATRQDINDIAFYDASNGIVVQTDATAGTYIVKSTTDGGATWNNVTVGGTMYPTEVEGVPGTNILVSGGSSTAFGFGSSFSNDLGASWNNLDLNASHTAIDFSDSITGFGGEFITVATPSVGGAWKFNGLLAVVDCGSGLATAGTSTVNAGLVCFNDTLIFSTTGAIAPNATSAIESGWAVLVSTADISGNNDPLSDPSIIGGTPAISANTTITLVNDNTIFPAGAIYYLTPISFGGASGAAGNLITTYTLDVSCTFTGQSVMANLLLQGDPLCPTGLNELNNSNFSISDVYPVPVSEVLNFTVNTKSGADLNVQLKDVTGREIYSSNIRANSGFNKVSLPVSEFASGIYTITVSTGSAVATSKFVKH